MPGVGTCTGHYIAWQCFQMPLPTNHVCYACADKSLNNWVKCTFESLNNSNPHSNLKDRYTLHTV